MCPPIHHTYKHTHIHTLPIYFRCNSDRSTISEVSIYKEIKSLVVIHKGNENYQ